MSRTTTGPSKETVVALLEGVDLFNSLNEEELEKLAEGAQTVEWDPDETLFEEGDDGDRCYIIASGSVKVVRRFPDGRRLMLARVGPGNVVGELALLSGERRSATVQAVDPTIAVALTSRQVLEILRTDANAALGLATLLANRLRSANERMFEYAMATVSGRVVATLLAQVEARLAQGAKEENVEVVGGPTDVARLAGSSKESVLRVLHWLENDGVISIKRGKMVIKDASTLAKYLR
jgi:CRP-like cAMP-binding protein